MFRQLIVCDTYWRPTHPPTPGPRAMNPTHPPTRQMACSPPTHPPPNACCLYLMPRTVQPHDYAVRVPPPPQPL